MKALITTTSAVHGLDLRPWTETCREIAPLAGGMVVFEVEASEVQLRQLLILPGVVGIHANSDLPAATRSDAAVHSVPDPVPEARSASN